MTTIGFIGLGHMGLPMVKNLLKNNFTVKAYDLSEKAMSACAKTGAIPETSPADVAKDADVVITMLQTGAQVAQSCAEIFEHLKQNALFIYCSSIDIQSSRELHAIAQSKNIAMLDAPVSGGVLAAQNATLTFMVGGDENNFKRAENILSVMGKKIIYAGLDGAGVAAKICNNMMLGISMIAVSEGFVLAEKGFFLLNIFTNPEITNE